MSLEDKVMREQHGSIPEEQDRWRFGNYDLVRRIDVGGMGEVYLAKQRTAFGREVAIKIIRSDLAYDMTARQRFLREAEVSAHLKHDHILQLIEFGELHGRLFFVTPYIEGGTLARRLRSGPLSLPEVQQLFSALVQAVAYIHRRGVIHRDLKPTNILLDTGSDGQIYVRLIDFGIATIQGRSASPPLTATGTEVGTAAYMAPERLSGIAAPSNDIYSLGVILYQMLTGLTPEAEQRPVAIPRPLEYIVQRCLAARPEDRFATADELLHAFESACQSLLSLRAASPVSSSVPPAPVAGDLPGVPRVPIVNRVSTPHPGGNPKQEVKTLQRSEDMPPLRPQSMEPFSQEDYEAPTSAFDAPAMQNRQTIEPPPVMPTAGNLPHPPRRGFRLSPLTIIPVLIVIILLTIASILFVALPATASATVSFSPQASSVSKVFQITAKTTVQKVDVGTASIPAKVLSVTKSASQTGQTTGQQFDASCFCFKRSVSSSDVDGLAQQLRQKLIQDISASLKGQLQARGGTQVGTPIISDRSETANPQIGTISDTVTVTLTEEGSAEYFLSSDAKQLARQLLTQEVQKQGTNFTLITSTVQIGQPVVITANTSAVVPMKIAAAGATQYQFSSSELASIKDRIKGMKLKDARAFLQRQRGVDPQSVSIRLTVGDTLPGDTQRITITAAASPARLPSIQLPKVTTSSTPSANVTPVVTVTAAVTATATPTPNIDSDTSTASIIAA